MKHVLLTAFLCLGFSLHAQTVDTLFAPKLTGELYVNETKHLGDLFFNNKWAESTLLLSNGTTVHGAKIKYQGFLDEVVWYNNVNYTPFILDRALISEFWTTDSLDRPVHFKHLQITDSTSRHPKDRFVQVLVEGAYALYIQHKVVNLPDQIVVRSNGSFAVRAFGQEPVYYIQEPSGNYLVLKNLGRNAFLRLFPQQKEALKALIRKHGIRLRTEEGLKEMVGLMSQGH